MPTSLAKNDTQKKKYHAAKGESAHKRKSYHRVYIHKKINITARKVLLCRNPEVSKGRLKVQFAKVLNMIEHNSQIDSDLLKSQLAALDQAELYVPLSDQITLATYGPCTATVMQQDWLSAPEPAEPGSYRLAIFRSHMR